MVEFWGDVGFLVFTLSTIIFTIIYLTMSRWYKSFVGTIIAVFTTGVVVLSLYLSLRIWNINVPGVDWVRLIIFWVLGIAMFISIIGFLEVQFGRRGKRFRQRLARRYVDVKRNDASSE